MLPFDDAKRLLHMVADLIRHLHTRDQFNLEPFKVMRAYGLSGDATAEFYLAAERPLGVQQRARLYQAIDTVVSGLSLPEIPACESMPAPPQSPTRVAPLLTFIADLAAGVIDGTDLKAAPCQIYQRYGITPTMRQMMVSSPSSILKASIKAEFAAWEPADWVTSMQNPPSCGPGSDGIGAKKWADPGTGLGSVAVASPGQAGPIKDVLLKGEGLLPSMEFMLVDAPAPGAVVPFTNVMVDEAGSTYRCTVMKAKVNVNGLTAGSYKVRALLRSEDIPSVADFDPHA